MRRAVTRSNRIDGMWAREASGITPGPLPWATGSDDLLLPKLGTAREWESLDINDEFTLDVSCGHTGNTRPSGMLSSWTPRDGFHTCSLPEQSVLRTKLKVL